MLELLVTGAKLTQPGVIMVLYRIIAGLRIPSGNRARPVVTRLPEWQTGLPRSGPARRSQQEQGYASGF